MKRTLLAIALLAILLASCAPAATGTPVPAMTATPDIEPIYFSLIGRTDLAYHNEAYYTQRLITGVFSTIGLDCSAGLLEADQKLMLISSIEWLAIRGDVQDIIDPPGTNSYTPFTIPGDGRDLDLSSTLPDPRLNAIEVVNSSISTGPCGFIVASGWLYEDVADLDLEYYAAEKRHTKASFEGEFLINPTYIQGEFTATQYSGNNWPSGAVENNLMIIEGGFPEPVVCSGISQPAWYSVEKLRETWDVNLDDSQVAGEFIHRRSVGDTIPMWGAYPPELDATILGTGWTYYDEGYHAYIILGLPEGCVQ